MFKAIRMFFSARMQYLQLNGAAPEEKEKSTRLGVQSIILAIIGIVLTYKKEWNHPAFEAKFRF